MGPGAYLRVAAFVAIYWVAVLTAAQPLIWLCGYFDGIVLSQFLAAVTATWIALRMERPRRFTEIGLWFNRDSVWNLAVGLVGGVGAAALTLIPPLMADLARWVPSSADPAPWGGIALTVALLMAGSAGEEILFHGYGFQKLLGVWGPFTTVLTVGAIFGALHGGNPGSTGLALVNTAGFGALFGWAFLRTGSLWMPIGLHFGWNFTLPLFGVKVSGLTIKLVGHDMLWNVGSFWSGGAYGPEGGILATVVLVALALFVWRAPVRKQSSEVLSCVP